MKFKFVWLLSMLPLYLTIGTSCKKTAASPGNTPVDSSVAMSHALDTALSVSRDFYLWYQDIPSTFNAQSYSDPNALMVALRAYSDEPGYSAPVDKWSFGVLKTDWNQLSGGIGSTSSVTSSGDFGFSVFFRVDGDLRVKLVERLSPAGIAGVQRGWRVLKINGSSNISIANSSFIVNAIFYSGSSTFTFQKPDGSTVDMTLDAATYQQQPVYLDTIYHVGQKTIGYVVINYFLGDTTQNIADYASVMNRFAAGSVTDVVVDIRYNGGGYVALQARLADYLAPAAANNKLMMTETFNDKHQNYNTSLYFSKVGPLNPDHVLFIVSQATASASELLINNLRPYMTVKLIGPTNTDGKPVGFFPISAGDWYVFPVSFRSENSASYGGYFNGFTPDKIVADGLDKNWGDTSEACLSEAIHYITSGTFIAQGIPTYKPDPAVVQANKALDQPAFKGMIDTRNIK